MIEYDKLIRDNNESFLAYLFAKNGLLGLFTQNQWNSDEYNLRWDLDALFLYNDKTTYNGIPVNQLPSNVWKKLDLWCEMAYKQLEAHFTKLHNLGKTDDEIAAIAAQMDKSNFTNEIARGIKQCTIHERKNEMKKDFP